MFWGPFVMKQHITKTKKESLMKLVKCGFPELSTGANKSSQVCDLENRGFGQTIQTKIQHENNPMKLLINPSPHSTYRFRAPPVAGAEVIDPARGRGQRFLTKRT